MARRAFSWHRIAVMNETSAEEQGIWAALLAAREHGAPLPECAGAVGAAARTLVEIFRPLILPRRGQRFITAHLGQSLDGRIATAAGASQWITGAADLLHTHRLRAFADAVVVGAATVRNDNPQLTVRRCAGRHPVRVVLDGERRLGPDYHVFRDRAAPTLLLVAADRASPGERVGDAEILGLPRARGEAALDPLAICDALAGRGLHALFLEGGGLTISRFLQARLIDRLHLAVAPMILGAGRPSLTLPQITRLAESLRPAIRSFALGQDVLYDCAFQ